MTFMTEVDPVVTEGSLLADETSKEEQLKAAAERINNAELTEGELDESMAPEHYEASDLRVLEGLEAVRIRPGMYIGSTGPRGLHHLVYEIVDNSVDEALAGYASHIEVTILPDNGIRVVDDGRGIPVDEVPGEGVSGVETVMTKLHAGGKFGGGGYAVSGGLHGVGISVVNALSTRVDIEVRRQGFHWTQTYIDQHPTAPLKQGEPMTEGESTGTSVTFWADPKIFETTIYDFETLRSRFQQMAFLNKGLKISLTDERENDQAGDEVAGDAADEPGAKHQTVTYQYLNGIKDYVDYLVKVRKATPVEEDVISFEAEGRSARRGYFRGERAVHPRGHRSAPSGLPLDPDLHRPEADRASAQGQADGGRRVHRHFRDLLGRRQDLRNHHLRFRDPAQPLPADGVPEQGPEDLPDRSARERPGRRRGRRRR